MTTDIVVAPLFVVLQSNWESLEMQRLDGEIGASSMTPLALQMVVYVAVAVQWLLRLEAPTWSICSIVVTVRVEHVSFNHLLHAIGCYVLLNGYSFEAGKIETQRIEDEKSPLSA